MNRPRSHAIAGLAGNDGIAEEWMERDLEDRFAAFVAAQRGRAVGLAWRLLGGDQAAAEDVAQDAFVRAFRGLDRFRGDAALPTWFYRILVNEVRRHQRWLAVRRRLGGLPGDRADALDAQPTAAAAGEPGDPVLRRRIARALDRLPRGQREAFVLVHLEGFTIQEAAESTGRAVGTLKSHLHRALEKLRADLDDAREGRGIE